MLTAEKTDPACRQDPSSNGPIEGECAALSSQTAVSRIAERTGVANKRDINSAACPVHPDTDWPPRRSLTRRSEQRLAPPRGERRHRRDNGAGERQRPPVRSKRIVTAAIMAAAEFHKHRLGGRDDCAAGAAGAFRRTPRHRGTVKRHARHRASAVTAPPARTQALRDTLKLRSLTIG